MGWRGDKLFSENFWYIGFLTLILMTMEFFAVLYLARHKWLSRIVLWALAAYVLVTQIVELSQTKTFFFAFSTIAYWLFLLGVLVPWRPLKSVCAVFAFIAGVVYTSGFLIYPEMLTHMGEFSIAYMSGYVIHNVLAVGSLLMLSQFEVKRYDLAVLGGAIAIVVVLTELGAHVWQWNNINAFLLGMVEGSVLKNEYFPDLPLTWWWYILWYTVMLAALWGIWEVIRLLNKKLFLCKSETKGNFVW